MGKKHRHLIEHIAADDNMRSAYHKTARGRWLTQGALAFKEYAEFNLGCLSRDLLAGD